MDKQELMLEDWDKSPDVLLRTVIQQLIMHELDVITESDWFRELVEESVKKIIDDKFSDEKLYEKFCTSLLQIEGLNQDETTL